MQDSQIQKFFPIQSKSICLQDTPLYKLSLNQLRKPDIFCYGKGVNWGQILYIWKTIYIFSFSRVWREVLQQSSFDCSINGCRGKFLSTCCGRIMLYPLYPFPPRFIVFVQFMIVLSKTSYIDLMLFKMTQITVY